MSRCVMGGSQACRCIKPAAAPAIFTVVLWQHTLRRITTKNSIRTGAWEKNFTEISTLKLQIVLRCRCYIFPLSIASATVADHFLRTAVRRLAPLSSYTSLNSFSRTSRFSSSCEEQIDSHKAHWKSFHQRDVHRRLYTQTHRASRARKCHRKVYQRL